MGGASSADRGDRAVITTRGITRLVLPDGPLSLRPRERAVLTAIAARHPRPVDADTVVRLVWGPEPPGTVRKSLHNHVSRIRAQAPEVIVTVDEGYALGDVTVDHTSGELSEVPLGDLTDSDDVDDLRRSIDEQFRSQLEREVRRALGRPTDESLRAASHLVDLRPDRERLWYLLAATQAGLGHRREALVSIGNARRALREFGLELGLELRQLESDLLEIGAPSAEATPEAPPTLPTTVRLHPHRDDPFVGRNLELDELEACWRRTLETGAPHLTIVRGPAGIGKTRLVDEFVRRVSSTAETSAPRVIASRERRNDDRALGGLTDVVDIEEPQAISPATATTSSTADDDIVDALQRQFDRSLARAASSPTIWCLDDLQWMASDTRGLLGRALETTTGPLLIVATHRSGELDDPGLLDRRAPTTVVELDPMDRHELEELVAAWHVLPDRSTTLDVFHERTAGLPFFVNEVARAASRRGEQLDALSVPGVLRDWVDTRLAELDEDASALLQVAALVGAEFHVDVLIASSDIGPDRADEILDDLVARGALGTGRRPGVFEFSHAITHEVAAERTGPAKARRQHLRIAETIAARPAMAPSAEWHASLAHHLHLGGGSPDEVRSHAMAACDELFRHGAWSAADATLTVALSSEPSGAERAELLARRGRARVRLQRFDEAAESLDEAIRLARIERLPAVRARAALDLVGRGGRGAAIEATDAERVEIVRGALDALGPDTHDSAAMTELRSELERELAFALLLGGDPRERDRLLHDSLDRIRRMETSPVRPLAAALLARRYARPEPHWSRHRLADIDCVLAMDPEQVGPETVAAAHVYRVDELLRAGRAEEARHSLGEIDHVLARQAQPYWAWAAAGWRVVVAVHDGDLEAAEALALEAWSTGGQSTSATAGFGVNLTNIRLLQGRSGEMIDLLSQAVETNPAIPAYRAVLTLCASEHGDRALAAEHLRWFSRDRFESLPEDPNRPLALAVLAHAVADLDDADAAVTLRPLVAPYDGQHIVISTYGGGGAYWGTASHALARLAVTMDDEDAAAAWFAAAREESVRAPLFARRVDLHAAAAATQHN